jgi:ketohexokinase
LGRNGQFLFHTLFISIQGVAARQGKSGRLIQQSAFPPPKLVDTLAAGDTFVAAAIHYLNKGRPLEEALEKACKLAGQKCGQQGLLNLDVSIL